MCRSKMAIDTIQQTSPPPPKKSSTKNHQTTSSSSQTTTSTTTMSTATTTTSSTTTSSSRRSLASLRRSLPDNPHLYDISEIRHATNNFLSKNIYTSSSSSSSSSSSLSWRCTLHGKDVIIFQHKRDNSSSKPLTRRTAAKKLSTLCRSHHVAVVPLLGASLSGDSHVYLVYDFVLHGSSNLSELLHNKINNNNNSEYTVLGSWMSRVQIASDVANGLDYIHNNSTGLDVTCVHNHVRSSSVIVTEQKQQRRQGQETTSFGAKLCHYGVSELCGEATEDRESVEFGVNGEIEEVGTTSFRKLSRSNSVKFNGTTGYMSPEFQVTGIGTRKSDVYAFGVILIELLSGEEPVKFKFDKSTKEYKKISVVDAAKALVEDDIGEREGKVRKWIDRRLRDSYPVDVAEKLTRLAVDCVHVDPNKRPDMRRVAGKISKLYLESKAWCEKMSVPTDFTVSFAPR